MSKHNYFLFFPTANCPSWQRGLAFHSETAPHTFLAADAKGEESFQVGRQWNGFLFLSWSFGQPLEGCHSHIGMSQACKPPVQALGCSLLIYFLWMFGEVKHGQAGCGYGSGWHKIPDLRPASPSLPSLPAIACALKASTAGQVSSLFSSLGNWVRPGSCPV